MTVRAIARYDWTRSRDAHQAAVHRRLDWYLDVRKRGESHPVVDFLFTYYRLSPAQLLRWHPGFGVELEDSHEYFDQRGYETVGSRSRVSREFLDRRIDTVRYVARLLAATAGRSPLLGCFGLHEWAMVYRTDDVRHSAVPLRLGSAGTDAVVESLPLRCTHYDAFRFFTGPAGPRNVAELSRESQVDHEQPGCLHAGMDVYRFATKLLPLVDSELLWRAFELAYSARELDMCASPYDLSVYGYEPVAIETAAGRAEYARRQAGLANAADPIRRALIERCDALLEMHAE